MPTLIGTHLGPYQVVEEVGRGGMATVYKAYHPATERHVAIKVLARELVADPAQVTRFEREAKLVASLQHIHILPLFDYGHEHEIAFLVMPYVPTGTLKTRLAHGPLPVDEAIRLLTQVASALDYANTHGVIHRDIKPANVLLDASHNALLSDFGMAVLAEWAGDLTRSGEFVGTPAYTAPECAQGKKADAHSDIYSLGVMFYEMVVGELPYNAPTPMAVVYQHINTPPPSARARRPDVPDSIDQVIRKALAKNPAERFQSAGDFATALSAGRSHAAARTGPTTHAPLPPASGEPLTATPATAHHFYRHIPLPPNYVPREELLAELRSALLAERPTLALTSAITGGPTALHGMGGIGKSVMARTLCDDPTMQAAFPDGILWTALGQEPNLIARLREWIEALGGNMTENVPTVDSLRANLAHLLAERACLLVVDDVWMRRHVEVFRVGGSRCRLLITTRDAEVARGIGAGILPIPTMNEREAVDLLEEWASGALRRTDPILKTQIVNRLGRLPLAVKLAGVQLQRKAPDKWLETFDARKLRSPRREDIHDSLEQTFALSLDALGDSVRRLYAALAIFRADEATPEAAVARVWNALQGLAEDETAELVDDLAARALLEVIGDTYPRALAFHDLLLDFMRAELGPDYAATHRTLLDAYRETQADDGWHTAPDDGYLYDHLAYHLRAAGAADEIQALFADQRWLHARVPASGYSYDGYLNDLSAAWEDFAHPELLDQIAAAAEPSAFADCLRYALIRTSINSVAGNYVPALVARAVETGLWTPGRALSVIARVPRQDRKAEMYTAILATGRLGPAESREAQRRGLEVARNAGWEQEVARLVTYIAPYLDPDLAVRGAEVAEQIEDEETRVLVIAALARRLEGEQREEVLADALDIALTLPLSGPFGSPRARALAALLPHLDDDRQKEALSHALQIVLTTDVAYFQYFRIVDLHDLLPYLDEAMLEYSLDVVLAAEDETILAVGLVALAPALEGDLLAMALQAARTMRDDPLRQRTLAELLSRLDDRQQAAILPDVLQGALSSPYASDRAAALTQLIPHVAGEQRTWVIAQAFKAALSITESEQHRAAALAALAHHLSGQHKKLALTHALDAALRLRDDRARAEVMAALAPHLSGELLTSALASALTISDHADRVAALAALAPQLDRGPAQTRVLACALRAAQAIDYDIFRAQALAVLAPHLDGGLLDSALDTASAIADESARARGLAVLIPHLEGEQKGYALELAALVSDGEEIDAAITASRAPGEARPPGLEAALALEDHRRRAQALAALLRNAPDPTTLLRHIRRDMAAHLLTLKDRKRDHLLGFCAQQDLFAPSVFSQTTLAAIVEHIIEICEEWQWL